MSDSGTLATIQAEIITALTSPEIQTGMPVIPAMSAEDLINKQTLRAPAIGVAYLGTDKTIQYAVGTRRLRATTKWRLFIYVTNLRGSQAARDDVYSILESARDRLHFYRSSISPKAMYLFENENVPDSFAEGRLVATADFFLDVILGN